MQRLQPRSSELAGGLSVRRVLPQASRRAVGPFVFFDHFGPVELAADVDSDVGPHPHIGLATITYLFEGRLRHRDSTGVVQDIAPGALNWMTAGRGVVHSERTPDDERGYARRLHGLQLWIATPEAIERVEPSFQHVDAESIPVVETAGALVRVLVGEAFGAVSPVNTHSPTLYLDITLPEDSVWDLPPLADEMAIYSPLEEIEVDDEALPACEMALIERGARLRSAKPARIVAIGGSSLGRRHMWWNFVSSDLARIEQAARAWEADEFPKIPDETGRVEAPPYVARPQPA